MGAVLWLPHTHTNMGTRWNYFLVEPISTSDLAGCLRTLCSWTPPEIVQEPVIDFFEGLPEILASLPDPETWIQHFVGTMFSGLIVSSLKSHVARHLTALRLYVRSASEESMRVSWQEKTRTIGNRTDLRNGDEVPTPDNPTLWPFPWPFINFPVRPRPHHTRCDVFCPYCNSRVVIDYEHLEPDASSNLEQDL